jgi:sulfonate transport system permease protein
VPRIPRRLATVRPWLSTLGLVVLWHLLTTSGAVRPTVLPAPGTLLVTAVGLVGDGSLPQALAVSLGRVLAGSAAGIGLGLVLGLGAGLWRTVDDVVDRPLQMLRAVPFTALTPLLLLWFGLGEAPKVVLVTVATLVPVYVNTLGGVRAVDPALLEVARAYGLGWWSTTREVLLPGARPAVLVGMRHALAAGWVAVVVAETVNASAGLGHLLVTARTYARTDVVLICIAVYAALGLLTDALVRLAERRDVQGADVERPLTTTPRRT